MRTTSLEVLNQDLKNFIKPKSNMDNPQDSIWYCLDWESEVITTTLCSTANVVSLTYPSIDPLNNPEDVLYRSTCASGLKFHTHPAEYYELPLVQKPTAIGLIIYKRNTHTHTHTHTLNDATLFVVVLRQSSPTQEVTKGSLGLSSLPHST